MKESNPVTRKRILLAAAALVVIAVGVVGGKIAWSRYGPVSAPNATVTNAVLDGQDVMMAVPPHPNGTLIIWVHGHDSDANEILTQSQSVPLRNALFKAGYTLAG